MICHIMQKYIMVCSCYVIEQVDRLHISRKGRKDNFQAKNKVIKSGHTLYKA